MKVGINLKKLLGPHGFTAVSVTTGRRARSSRWMIYDGNDHFRGDLVRWRHNGRWSWMEHGDALTPIVDGTINRVVAEIIKLEPLKEAH